MNLPSPHITVALSTLMVSVGLTACSGGAQNEASDCDAPLTVAHATNEVWGVAPIIAEKEGFFAANGVEIDKQVLFEGDSQVAQALQSGQAQIGLASGYPILGTLDSGRPLIMTSLLAAKETDMLVSSREVSSPAALDGKVVAINDIGGGVHAAAVWALQELSVDPSKVTLVQVGAQSDRLAAVIGGSAAAAPVDRANRSEVEGQGLKVLIDLADTDLLSAKHGVIMSKNFTESCADKAQAFTRSLAQAQQVLMQNPTRAGEILADWSDIDSAQAAALIEDAEPLIGVQACLAPTEDAFRTSLDFLRTTNDAVDDVDPTQAYTTTFTDQLISDGTFEELGLNCAHDDQ